MTPVAKGGSALVSEPVTLEEQITELDRELALRARVYPRWVAAKKIRADTAQRQMARLRAAHRSLEVLREIGRHKPQTATTSGNNATAWCRRCDTVVAIKLDRGDHLCAVCRLVL